MLLRHAGKVGLGLLIVAALMTGRSAGPALVHPAPHALATNVLPTSVPCGTIQVDPATNTAVWTATSSPYGTGSPYILPWNDPKIPSTDTTRQPNCLTTDAHGNPVGDDLHLAPGTKLVIDGSQGPVQIFSHGTGISVDGGEIRTINTSTTNFISFDAEPDVASWDGIAIHAPDAAHVGDGSFSYVTIQHALTALSIDSGATSSPDSANYGLTVANSGIGPSYFDGIDATNTPISVTGLGDGQYGTVNNIGSQGINVTYTSGPPAPPVPPPAVINDTVLKVTGMTFGSSVPFGETGCPPEPQTCANRVVGSIGNNAVVATLLPNMAKPAVIDQNKFFRAGSFGVDLENANHPQITNNLFVCNGSGSPSPVTTCTANGTLQKFSAIYLNNVTADLPDTTPPPLASPSTSGVSNNIGQENGLDATVLSGRVTSNVTWMTPRNDPSPPDPAHLPHNLGYMVANVAGTGGLEILGKTLSVAPGDVVKVEGGGITLTGGALNATGGQKTFTSMRDNLMGIQACPSVFVQSCLDTLPSNEWLGIDLSGASGNITNAYILYPTKGVYVTNAPSSVLGPDSNSYGLVLTGSTIGPTFSDSVATSGTAAYIASNRLCRMDEAPTVKDVNGVPHPNPNYLLCVGAGPGDHGVNADFSGTAGTLTLRSNSILGSTNEAILGMALGSATVDIESNTIDKAGSFGLHLVGASNPTIIRNVISRSGTSTTTPPAPPTTTYSAMLLSGLTNANFQKQVSTQTSPPCTTHCITWNTGFGNGLDAIAFDGSVGSAVSPRSLDWMSPANVNASAPLGYLLSDGLQVSGDLTLNANDLVEVAHGAITVSGTLSAPNALITSIKQDDHDLPAGFPAVRFPTCGSIFAPLSSKNCQNAMPGDWTGLILNVQKPNTFNGTSIRYPETAIRIDQPQPPALPTPTVTQSINQTSIKDFADTGIHSNAYLVISGGQLKNANPSNGNGIWFDHGANISGTQISKTGQEAILGTNLNTNPIAGMTVIITGTSLDSAGTYGIRLAAAAPPLDGTGVTLINNMVTNSGRTGSTYPAIQLNAISNAIFLLPTDAASGGPSIQNNTGSGNGLDATAFHGSVAQPLTWITAYKNQPGQVLGYLLDGDLDMNGNALTVRAGDIVKVGNGGTINLDGGQLQADDTSTSSQKIFTSLSDNAAGVAACPSVFLAAGCGTTTGYWGGILLPTSGAKHSNGALVNALIRYANTGIDITSGATSTSGSSTYGLLVSHSTIGPTQADAVDSTQTAISITNSTISGSVHGISADLTGASPGTALRFSGNRFVSTSAEAILGQALAGQPVWITDNQVQHAGTFGMRLVNANELVLRNNNISTSGTGATLYSAAYLPGVNANFGNDIRGNVGQGNGINAIVVDGTAQGDFAWSTPPNSAVTTTKPLGFMLDGGLTLQGGTLSVKATDVVKALAGPITISGGSLSAADTGVKTFTSVRDPVSYASCPSVFAPTCGPGKGDWGGLVITSSWTSKGSGAIKDALIDYATTGISIDSGPIVPGELTNFRLMVKGNTQIFNASKDGINAFDTPISVTDTAVIGDPQPLVPLAQRTVNIGGEGIVASFFSPANAKCTPDPANCSRLTVSGATIQWTGKDGIAATGLGGQPAFVTGNTIDHAMNYGIQLVGADTLTLTGNMVTNSGAPAGAPRYPAVHLKGVRADFETAPGAGVMVQGNHGNSNGLDAVAFDGEATNNLNWINPATSSTDALFGYVAYGSLTVDGSLTTKKGDVVKILNGGIKINPLNGAGGTLNVADTTTFTSLKDPNVGISACNSVFVPDPCPGGAGNTDWNGINVDAGPSQFINGRLFDATSGITMNGARLDVSGAIFTNISGFAIHTLGTGYAVITSSSIHGNGGGVQSDGSPNTSIGSSDIFGNTTPPGTSPSNSDVVATVSTTAIGDWWGAFPPDSHQYNSNGLNKVTVSPALAQQAPSLLHAPGKIAVSSDNTNSAPPASSTNPYLGKGKLTVTLTFDRAMDTSTALNVTFAGGDNISHAVVGTWNTGSNTVWTGTATVDGSNAAGDNKVTVSGGKSNMPEGTIAMAPETSNTTDTPFYINNVQTASVVAGGTATNITPTSATLRDSVNPNGWSDPSLTNPNTDTAVFFQYKLSTVSAWPFDPVAFIQGGGDPSTQPGYQKIGHGTAPVNVSATLATGSLVPSKTYDYRAVAVDLNGVSVGNPDTQFTTLAAGTLDHFTFDVIPTQTAGTAFNVTVTAYDATNTALIGYTGATASLTNNLSTAPTGCGGSCPPQHGVLTWDPTTGKGTITGAIAYVAEPNRKFTMTDGAISSDSGTFTVTNSGTEDHLGFASSPQALKVNTVSSQMTVQLEDQYSNAINEGVATDVNLTVTPNTAGSFSSDSAGTTPITKVQMAMGASTVQFFFKGTATGAPVLTAQATDVTSGTQTETVAAQLYFKTGPQTGLTVGAASGPITIELEDASGSPIAAGSDVIVTLVLPATDPSGHFRDSANTMDITQLTIAKGSSSATFLYKPGASGNQTIAVHVGGGIPDAQQTEVVS